MVIQAIIIVIKIFFCCSMEDALEGNEMSGCNSWKTKAETWVLSKAEGKDRNTFDRWLAERTDTSRDRFGMSMGERGKTLANIPFLDKGRILLLTRRKECRMNLARPGKSEGPVAVFNRQEGVTVQCFRAGCEPRCTLPTLKEALVASLPLLQYHLEI